MIIVIEIYNVDYDGNPMDREAWQVTVHAVPRVRHNLVTPPPPPQQ